MITIENRKEFAKAARVIQGYMCHIHVCSECPLSTLENECGLVICLSELKMEVQEDD